MSVLSSIEKWFARFKPYIFTYKKGFFELHYLANSPQSMIGAFKKIPFVNRDDEKQSISANSIFLSVLFYYREVEEELFVLCSETKFKANVSFKHYYDKSIPANYYCLSLCLDHHEKFTNSIVNDAGVPDDSWLLFKPGAKVIHHHFKGTTGRYITVYFTNEWLENYLQHINKEARQEWMAFLHSDSDHLICPHLTGNELFNEENLFQLFFSQDKFKGKNYMEMLRTETLRLMNFFSSKMRDEGMDANHFTVSNRERIVLLQVRHVLKEKVYEKFPGIDVLAKEGLSETKLKECFKRVYNKTLFQHFQGMQMEKAKEMMFSTDLKIAEIADKFGYENASKFSDVFREFNGCLPSELKRRE